MSLGSISSKPLSFCLHTRYGLAKNQPQQRFLALEQRRLRCSNLSCTPPLKRNDEAILRQKTVEGRKKMRTVCSAVPVSTARNLQWISTIASIVLMLSKGTAVNKCLLVPLLALQAPTAVVSWVKGEYGIWAAFMGLLVRLFFFIPGELELPFMALLLVILAPYQVLNLRWVDVECNKPKATVIFHFVLRLISFAFFVLKMTEEHKKVPLLVWPLQLTWLSSIFHEEATCRNLLSKVQS
ncbi:unnamed protein product [Linum tenue]|uniref:Uncharacterized protein n=1 Tax=Linum tenue TaxID=586396 RepID=A0AAV0KQ90_9ROSI|nr:unnamed protein product [Linum tenue]